MASEGKGSVKDLSQEDLFRLRAQIHRVGWSKFMMHIGSLMAEQADKVPDGPQEVHLFNSANMIHALHENWEVCGHFDYIKAFDALGIMDPEFRPLFEEK